MSSRYDGYIIDIICLNGHYMYKNKAEKTKIRGGIYAWV